MSRNHDIPTINPAFIGQLKQKDLNPFFSAHLMCSSVYSAQGEGGQGRVIQGGGERPTEKNRKLKEFENFGDQEQIFFALKAPNF